MVKTAGMDLGRGGQISYVIFYRKANRRSIAHSADMLHAHRHGAWRVIATAARGRRGAVAMCAQAACRGTWRRQPRQFCSNGRRPWDDDGGWRTA